MTIQPAKRAIELRNTKELAHTNPIKSNKLFIHIGTAPPAAKNENRSPLDLLEKHNPINGVINEKATITNESVIPIIL